MKRLMMMLICIVMAMPSFAGEKSSELPGQKKSVRESVLGHFKFYGFVRNYFAFDTREGVVGAGDLLYYIPKDHEWNVTDEEGRQDLNATSTFRFLALTNRLGLNVTGYKFGNTDFSAKLEADFICGLSSKGSAGTIFPNASAVSGTALLRLRHAYVTLGWKDLKMGGESTAAVSLKIGQAWHPLSADHPALFSLGAGMPFNPFSRTPQLAMDADLGEHGLFRAHSCGRCHIYARGLATEDLHWVTNHRIQMMMKFTF